MNTEVDVPNPPLTLIPSMYAEVKLRIDERLNALAIPLDAVDRSGASPHVYTVTGNGVLHVVPVTVGLENDRWIEVRSGLQEGNTVVIGRRAGLKDGQKVEIRSSEAQGQ